MGGGLGWSPLRNAGGKEVENERADASGILWAHALVLQPLITEDAGPTLHTASGLAHLHFSSKGCGMAR